MTEEFTIQLLFSFLFVSSDSIATTLALALKLIEENPKVLEDLIVRTLLYVLSYVSSMDILLFCVVGLLGGARRNTQEEGKPEGFTHVG